MARYRIGNDITIIWTVNDRNGAALPLADKDVRLFYTCERGRYQAEITIQDTNKVVWDFSGGLQKVLGGYSLTLEILQSDGKRSIKKDVCNAFLLVAKDCEADAKETTTNGELAVYQEQITTNLDIARISPIIPVIVEDENGVGYWYIDGVNTGDRATGESAYDYAKQKGYEGTEEEFAEQMAAAGEGIPSITKFAGYLLPKAKIEITSGSYDDGTYYRKVKIPYDTAFICGMNNTFYTSADVIVENNTSAGYLYCVVNAKTKTFRLSSWTLTLGADEYLFFGFNVNARYATLDPYSYTINGKSNAGDISRLGGIAYIAYSIPDIDDDSRVMSFPDCQFSIGKKKVYLSACQLSLDGETSSWKTILLNTVSSTVELSSYAKEVPEGCVILGNIDCSYTGSSVMGKVQRAFFPFPVSVNGKDISTSVSNLQNGKTGATIMENNGYSDSEIKFIQSNWPSKVSTASQTPRLTLCHFSDIHGSADNYNRIVEFTDAFRDHLDDVISTGDLVADNATNDFSFWTDSRILAVIGNHDSAIYSNGKYDWTGYGQVQTYNKYFKPFIASWGVTQPANAESKGLLYYYKDYTTKGVRLIALDCMFWDDAQNVWLEETLEDARVNELAVMIAVHYPKGMDTFDCPFTSLHKDSCDYLQQQPIDTVQNFIDNGGEFVAWLAGHTHLDYVGVVKGTDQLMVVVENGGLDDLWNDSKRVKGTKSQDSFNIVSVDTFDKTLTLFRIGNDRDKWLRKKDTLCIDYSANKILYTLGVPEGQGGGGSYDDTAIKEQLTELSEELESNGVLIEDLQNTKIDKEADDYYPQLAVGLADNLAGVDVVDSEINFRRSGAGAISDGVARIETIKGNSVVWNQKFAPRSYNIFGVSTTYTDGKYHSVGQVTDTYFNLGTFESNELNHVYLFIVEGLSSSFSGSFSLLNRNAGDTVNNGFAYIFHNNTGASRARYIGFSGLTVETVIDETYTLVQHDLTQMFGAGNEPTTIEEFYSRIPMGIDEYAYNEGEVIHMDVQSVESQGVNAWDEEWESGHFDKGQPISDSTRIRSKNFIQVLPNTSYHCTQLVTFFFYDVEYQYISLDYSQDTTTPSNAMYMKFSYGGSVNPITTYNHDICINISDTSINGNYYPYIKRVEDLSIIRKYFPQGMKSAGSAHDEIRYNKATQKWEMVQRIGEVDMGTLNYYNSAIGTYAFYTTDLQAVAPKSPNRLLCSIYTYGSQGEESSSVMSNDINGVLYFSLAPYTDAATFKAAMQGVMLYYELAEPIVTELDAEDQFKDLDYQVWNAGTEKAIAEGKSAPLAADITYGFNAIGKIKELESLVAALRAKVGI